MEKFTQDSIAQTIEEINGESEVTRRAKSKKRLDIYRDGGKKFLLEQLEREFSQEAIPEMRLAPINLLKKLINKKASLYNRAPVRLTEKASDQALIDHYTHELDLNSVMLKAHRYLCLLSNNAIYARPYGSKIKLDVVPSHLYSIVPNQIDRTKVDAWVFSAFTEYGRVAPNADVPAATGVQGYDRSIGTKTEKDKVASLEKEADSQNRQYIFWSPLEHFTVNSKSERMILDPAKGEEQWINPIGISPVVNLARDRDNESWASQGEDMIDLTVAVQSGWTDLLTIAKHQGFSILTVVSAEQPQQLKLGINKAVWLRAVEGQTAPSISYVQGSSPLDQYKDLLLDLTALLLSTNDMNPGSVGGRSSSRSFTSGFHALIEMSDTIEAAEADKPILQNAEAELWEVIKRWHNFMLDAQVLDRECAALGKFSDDFKMTVFYRDMKPIESEQERISAIKELMALGLMTRADALRKLNPDLNADAIDQKLAEIDAEATEYGSRAMKMIESKPEVEDESENGEAD